MLTGKKSHIFCVASADSTVKYQWIITILSANAKIK